MARRRRRNYEFRPDPRGTNLLKKLHLTNLQRQQLLKWSLLSLVALVSLVAQDSILSRLRISGATTDLAVCAILLIGVFEGSENGGLFALIASTIYYFSGSAPGTYAIALITALTLFATLFRQAYWRKGFTSTILCAGLALVLYEMAVFGIGMFLGLTIWARAGVFFLTGVLSCIMLLPLYPLVRVISKIGGELWKE